MSFKHSHKFVTLGVSAAPCCKVLMRTPFVLRLPAHTDGTESFYVPNEGDGRSRLLVAVVTVAPGSDTCQMSGNESHGLMGLQSQTFSKLTGRINPELFYERPPFSWRL